MVMVPTTPSTDGEDHGNSDCCSGGTSPSSVSKTNWRIAHGFLERAVTLESSDSPPFDPASTPKSPLIVKPHSPGSDPCEIKISFDRKHEIQQVYVRSTARVYEIYYASSLHGENMYLCTVRCCVAEREGEVLLAGNEYLYEDASKQHADVTKGGSYLESFIGKEKTGSNSEEEWVDVKVPSFPVDKNGINSLVNQSTMSNSTSVEELYEATAEIRDAEPCASLTIRFLSLQSKDCLYVDELYIFGDPFVSTDSENDHTPSVESSAHSSLMAMLIPTFLQLSKSSIKQTAETHPSDNSLIKNDEEATFRRSDMHDDKTNEVDCEQRSMAANDDKSDIGKVLGQLVDRVSKVEEICLRFEESMLKPINNMETRLQRVEEQIENLAKNSQYTGHPSCKRFTAPSFSCTESNFGSFYNDGNNHPANLASEFKMDDDNCSADSPHAHPSLVIAAPEFSSGEEEEQRNGMSGATEEGNRKGISIDDALAAALSGFLSTSAVSVSESSKQTSASSSKHNGESNIKDENIILEGGVGHLGGTQTENEAETLDEFIGRNHHVMNEEERQIETEGGDIFGDNLGFGSLKEQESGIMTMIPLDILLGGVDGNTESNAISEVDAARNSDSLLDYYSNNSDFFADVDDNGSTTLFAEQGAFVVSSLI